MGETGPGGYLNAPDTRLRLRALKTGPPNHRDLSRGNVSVSSRNIPNLRSICIFMGLVYGQAERVLQPIFDPGRVLHGRAVGAR